MKRPQGFQRPEEAAPTGRKITARSNSGRSASGRNASGRNVADGREAEGREVPSRDWPSTAESEPTTEPIVLPQRGGSRAQSDGPPLALDDGSNPSRAETDLNTPGQRAWSLGRVARERRRYERAEVKRFTRHSRRRRAAWLLSIASLAVLVLAVTLTAFSPALAVRTIDVVGASRVDAGQLRRALADQLGRPLPLVDFAAVKRQLAKFPLIRSYSTESRPPGTLVVRIVERQPIAVVPAGSRFSLVDPAGVVISTSDSRPGGYPLVTDTATSSKGFDAATGTLLALPPSMLSQVNTVSATTNDDVTFVLRSGQRVVWGGADHADLKATVLTKLIAATAGRGVNEYDVSSPMSPVTR